VVAGSETVSQPFQFVGQFGVMAEPNGFYYMRARYYDPSVGRFVSEDPLGFDGGDVNLYAYVLNNPVMRADATGLAPGDPFLTQEAAAIDAIDTYISDSNKIMKEYGGWVYYNPALDRYSYTPAVIGNPSNMKVSTFNQPPSGTTSVAIYHTHPGSDYTVGSFSTDDYLQSGIVFKNIYLGTISGLVKV